MPVMRAFEPARVWHFSEFCEFVCRHVLDVVANIGALERMKFVRPQDFCHGSPFGRYAAELFVVVSGGELRGVGNQTLEDFSKAADRFPENRNITPHHLLLSMN